MTIALVIVGLFILVMINVPIAVGRGVVAVVGMMISRGFDSVYNAALTMFDGATNFPLLAIPLFILAGALMNTTSISRRLPRKSIFRRFSIMCRVGRRSTCCRKP